MSVSSSSSLPTTPRSEKATMSTGTAPSTENKPVDAKRYKTKVCRTFMTKGECPYETRCMFAHGDHELRTAEQNLAEGLVSEGAIKKHQQALLYTTRGVQPQMAAGISIPMPPTEQHAQCTCPTCMASYSGYGYSHMPHHAPAPAPHHAHHGYDSYSYGYDYDYGYGGYARESHQSHPAPYSSPAFVSAP